MDSGGDTGDWVDITPLGNGYELKFVLMCGYCILKDGKPITNCWSTHQEVAKLIVKILENK